MTLFASEDREFGELRDWSAEKYHADLSAISRGAIEDYRSSPRLFHGRWINGNIGSKQDTDAMRRGRCVHAILEGRESMAPWQGDRRGKAWKEFEQESLEAGLEPVTMAMYRQVHGIVESMLSDRQVRGYYENASMIEQVAVWADRESGLLCRCMFDLVTDNDIIVDPKVTVKRSPADWKWHCLDFGYHRQIAHYTDGFAAVLGRPWLWRFVVVCSEPPYDVFVAALGPDEIALGRRQRARALGEIRDRLDRKDWSLPTDGQIVTIEYPRNRLEE